MHPRRAKHAIQWLVYRVPDMGSPWWLSRSKRVPLDTLDTPDTPDLDPTSIETEPSTMGQAQVFWSPSPPKRSPSLARTSLIVWARRPRHHGLIRNKTNRSPATYITLPGPRKILGFTSEWSAKMLPDLTLTSAISRSYRSIFVSCHVMLGL